VLARLRFFSRRRVSAAATRLFLSAALLLTSGSLSNIQAQELKELIRRNRRLEDRDPLLLERFDWPKYEWQQDQLNLSQIFSGRKGARLPLIWLGEVGEGYVSGAISPQASAQHVRADRVVSRTSVRGGEEFILTVLVPHPKSVDMADLRVIQDFKRALPKADEVEMLRPLTFKGLEGMLYNRSGGGHCYISLKLPRSAVLNLYGACRMEPLMLEILNKVNLQRLLDKISS
jgi:hypothetical protein